MKDKLKEILRVMILEQDLSERDLRNTLESKKENFIKNGQAKLYEELIEGFDERYSKRAYAFEQVMSYSLDTYFKKYGVGEYATTKGE